MVETTVPLNMLYLDFALFIFHHIHSHTGWMILKSTHLYILYVQIEFSTIYCWILGLFLLMNNIFVNIYLYQLLILVKNYIIVIVNSP